MTYPVTEVREIFDHTPSKLQKSVTSYAFKAHTPLYKIGSPPKTPTYRITAHIAITALF